MDMNGLQPNNVGVLAFTPTCEHVSIRNNMISSIHLRHVLSLDVIVIQHQQINDLRDRITIDYQPCDSAMRKRPTAFLPRETWSMLLGR